MQPQPVPQVPPSEPNSTHQPSQLTADTAEDMVARAMALSAIGGTQPTGGNEGTQQLRPHAGNSPSGIVGDTTAAGNPSGEISEDELPNTDDETADMDVQVRDGETAEQHSSRVRKLLKEKLQRVRAAKEAQKEREERKFKAKDGKGPKEKPRAKATLKK